VLIKTSSLAWRGGCELTFYGHWQTGAAPQEPHIFIPSRRTRFKNTHIAAAKKVHAQTMQAPAESVVCFWSTHPKSASKQTSWRARSGPLWNILSLSLGGKCGNVVATGIESMHVFAPRVWLWISPHYAAAKGCELLRGGASGLRVEHKGKKNQVAAAAAMWVSFDASLLLYNNTSV
jgi:hypothetical protein